MALSYATDFTDCLLTYKKVGCYQDRGDDRVFKKLEINDRNLTTPDGDNHLLDWRRYPDSVHRSGLEHHDFISNETPYIDEQNTGEPPGSSFFYH